MSDGGEAPDPAEVFAVLVREPFNLTVEQIGKLTPWQVKHIYFRKETKEQGRRVQSHQELFFAAWRQRGWKEKDIWKKWEEEGHGQRQ